MKNLKLDGEVADQICCSVLKQHMKLLKRNIKKLEAVAPLPSYIQEDLGNDLNILACMKVVYTYFSGETA